MREATNFAGTNGTHMIVHPRRLSQNVWSFWVRQKNIMQDRLLHSPTKQLD